MKTNYAKAWEDFTGTSSYQSAVEAMEKRGMEQPYIDNCLRPAFDAGWGDRKIVLVNEDEDMKSSAFAMLKSGDRIGACRYVIQKSGLSLKDAKAYIDNLYPPIRK